MANEVIQGSSFGTDLPKTEVDEVVLNEEKKMAKYSKTKEFKRLKEFLEARIKYFENFLPGGQPVAEVPAEERAAYWQASCVIIKEFRSVLNEYEAAAESVAEKDV
jgi:hypothetical protein